MAAILGVASGRGSPRRIPPTFTPALTFSGDSLRTENPFEPLRRREAKYSVTDNISFLGCFTHTELHQRSLTVNDAIETGSIRMPHAFAFHQENQ